MPHATDHLDVVVVPADPGVQPDPAAVGALFDRWQAQGLLAAGTGSLRRAAGPLPSALLPGGFRTLWLDLPGQLTLYANQQGGFRVRCPACRAPLARAFGEAVEDLRHGGAGRLTCGACGHSRPAVDLPLEPPGAFARGAVVFGDAGGVEPTPAALSDLARVLGGVRVVLRRRA